MTAVVTVVVGRDCSGDEEMRRAVIDNFIWGRGVGRSGRSKGQTDRRYTVFFARRRRANLST